MTETDNHHSKDDYLLSMDDDNCCTSSRPGTITTNAPPPYTPKLPSELILFMFKFLTAAHDLRSAILVCKLWCSCGMNLLWSKPALLTLSVAERMAQTMALPSTIFPYANYIRRLNLSFIASEVTDPILIQFEPCVQLERLLLAGSNKATITGLQRVLSGCSGLYSLDLSDIPAVTDALIEYVAENCPRLHTLYVGSCSSITDDSIVKLAKSCLQLKRIKLSQCTLLTDRAVLALTEHCPQLIEIDFTNCSLLTDTAIQSVFTSLPQIRDINMTLLTNLTDAAFASINPKIHRFEQLRVLNFTSCANITDETLLRIIPAAPRLRSLALTKCDRITDTGASVIKTLGKHLHYLHLGHCAKITDRLIVGLSQYCTRIRYLDLACCTKITDTSIFALAQLPKLRRIGLVKCSNITDYGIYAMLVSQILPQTLERVHLSYCVNLSDTAISSLVTQCRKLTHLSLTGVPAFIWPRYQMFCRPPPPEFTAHQREVFCVFSGKGVRDLRKYMHENVTSASAPANLANIRASYRMMSLAVSSMLAGGAEGPESVVPLPPFSEEPALWAQMGAVVEMAPSEPVVAIETATPLMADEQEGIEGGGGEEPMPLVLQNSQEMDNMDQAFQDDDMEGVITSDQDPPVLAGAAATTVVQSLNVESSGPLVFRNGAGGQSSTFRDVVPAHDGDKFPSLQHPGHSHHCLQGHRELELGGSSHMEVDSGQEETADCSRVSSPSSLARSLNREGEGSGAGSTSPAEEEEEDGDDDDEDDDF
ncbi:SCF ubiquitin ligase complex subunit [Linnemannia gamsii]|uniref:SCF ubiquitin ligase complex subunit n=1 Tax=Linnemannia gamsii TaxID=64522 RepID=A0ABQ7K8N5_9FUNG|nr:SCF ubiquitin ligase complex subunit [Linnemannia gamsii]